MKHLHTFSSFINENRIDFDGKTGGDVYEITKKAKSALFFAKGKYYSVENDELIQSQADDYIYGTDEDGGEHEVKVSDIEFIELNK